MAAALPRQPGASEAAFPETQSAVLMRAAGGDWGPFFDEYLAPCWREIVLASRGRIPPDDAADLLQELTVRLLREGKSRPLPEVDGEAPPRGNIPQRFLARRGNGVEGARFRTYLKRVICNLIEEQARGARRNSRHHASAGKDIPDPAIEDSVSGCLDRGWILGCLGEAARRFHDECQASRTRGRRRLFEILYLATVRGLAARTIADQLGLDRTTVAADLTTARDRFVELLAELSGISDRAELKAHVAADPDRLFESLEQARGQADNAARLA